MLYAVSKMKTVTFSTNVFLSNIKVSIKPYRVTFLCFISYINSFGINGQGIKHPTVCLASCLLHLLMVSLTFRVRLLYW